MMGYGDEHKMAGGGRMRRKAGRVERLKGKGKIRRKNKSLLKTKEI